MSATPMPPNRTVYLAPGTLVGTATPHRRVPLTVKISRKTKSTLKLLSVSEGRTMSDILDEAVARFYAANLPAVRSLIREAEASLIEDAKGKNPMLSPQGEKE